MTPDELDDAVTTIREGIYGDDRMTAADADTAVTALSRLRAHVDTLTAERDELAATIENERGEGAPPSDGWEYVRGDGYLWRHEHGTVERRASEGWKWRCFLPPGCGSIRGPADTAREGMRTCLEERARFVAAMRAADAAVPR